MRCLTLKSIKRIFFNISDNNLSDVNQSTYSTEKEQLAGTIRSFHLQAATCCVDESGLKFLAYLNRKLIAQLEDVAYHLTGNDIGDSTAI